MTLVRLLTEAEEELKKAAEFYESQHEGLGRAFANEVQIAVGRIRDMPLASRIERGDIRVRSIARFPYRVYYRPSDSEILVVAIGHRRQRPGFWQSRV